MRTADLLKQRACNEGLCSVRFSRSSGLQGTAGAARRFRGRSGPKFLKSPRARFGRTVRPNGPIATYVLGVLYLKPLSREASKNPGQDRESGAQKRTRPAPALAPNTSTSTSTHQQAAASAAQALALALAPVQALHSTSTSSSPSSQHQHQQKR
jgi:hypothetical protein